MEYSKGIRRLADVRKQIAAVRGAMRKVAAAIERDGAAAWRPRFGYA